MLDHSLTRAGQWFLRSGIQETSGGVARYYRIEHELNNPVSTEITGYAISALCFLYQRTADTAYRDAAIRSAQFLVTQAWQPELALFPFEWPPSAQGMAPAYFFDAGIIIRGLLRVFQLTGDRCWLKAAVAAGEGMFRHVKSQGEIVPILHLPEVRAVDYGGSWSNNPGCYQLKSALAWHELANLTGDARFANAWQSALQQALATQHDFLPGVHDHHRVMDRLHAFCYFLEALTATRGHEEIVREGIVRVGRYLREIRSEFVRSDVCAQLLRVRLMAAMMGILSLDEAAAANEAETAARFQYTSADARLDGGYCFGARFGEWLPFANPVSTAFCMQALVWWDDYKQGRFKPDYRDII